ncbi:MAG: hypothetical protein KAI66_00320 [Lentisphaeria bacterium]|nr:hypothetical protein [Lentisphaeria bacterium]
MSMVEGRRDANGQELPTQATRAIAGELTLVGTSYVRQPGSLQIRLVFNGRVEGHELKKRLEIRHEGAVRTFILRDGGMRLAGYGETSSVFRAELVSPVGRGKLEVRIQPGLKAVDGDTATTSLLVQTMEIGDAIRLHGFSASEGGMSLEIRFHSSDKLDLARLKTHIRIQPDLPLTFQREYWSEAYIIHGAFTPRALYRVTFLQGLRAMSGAVLEKDETHSFVMPNFSPSASFATSGPVMPSQRHRVLPVRFRNVSSARFRAYHVYANNLVHYMRRPWRCDDDYGHMLGETKIETGLATNEIGVRNVPLDPLLGGRRTGVFVVTGSWRERYYSSISTRLILTNLGLGVTLTDGEAFAWVLSLDGGQPVSGCQVEIRSYRNQILGQGITDDAGKVTFALSAEDADDEPFLAIASKGEDLAPLLVTPEESHDLTAFRFDGIPYPEDGYNAFVYTGRGVCRPGETVRVGVVVRDPDLGAAADVPVDVWLQDPDGGICGRVGRNLSAYGVATCEFTIPASAKTGQYLVRIGAPGEHGNGWGQASLLVAYYRPDEIECELTIDRERYALGDVVETRLHANHFFGSPAANATTSLSLRLAPAPFAPESYKSFTFGDSGRKWERPSALNLPPGTTDEQGQALFHVTVPTGAKPPAALRMTLAGGVTPHASRTVTAFATADVHVYPYYIGLKKLQSEDGEHLRFEWVALKPDGSECPPPSDLRIDLYQETWRYVLEESDGYFRRRWLHDRCIVESARIGGGGKGRGTVVFDAPGPGNYVLIAENEKRDDGPRTTLGFWYYKGDVGFSRSASPAVLRISSDAPTHAPGATATLSFSSPFEGVGMLCVGSDQISHTKSLSIEQGANQVRVPIPATAFGSVYAALTLVRNPDDSAASDEAVPIRLYGVARLDVDQSGHQLNVVLSAPALARPLAALPVEIELRTNERPASGTVHLLAVDEGVLSLSAFHTPDPFAFFHGARSCPFSLWDPFDELYPDVASRFADVSVVGGGGDAVARLACPFDLEEVQQAVVLQRIVEVDASGRAQVSLELPDHTGALRLMAIAVNADAVGSAEQRVKLRHEISVMVRAPRAAAPGDVFEVTAQVFNHDVDTSELQVELTLPGGLSMEGAPMRALRVIRGGQGRLAYTLRVGKKFAGEAKLMVSARSGAVFRTVSASVLVRPPTLPVYDSGVRMLRAGETLRLPEFDVLAGTREEYLRVDETIRMEAMPALAWLLRYPYGCLEQTVSRAMPELVMGELVHGIGSEERRPATEQLETAVLQVMTMECRGGRLGSWPGAGDPWPDGMVYAAHFLVEAKRRGVAVEPAFLDRVLGGVRELLTIDSGGSQIEMRVGYAVYVLALAGQPENSFAQALAEDGGCVVSARIMASAALLAGGRAKTGAACLRTLLLKGQLADEGAGLFCSESARCALALSALLRTMPDSPNCPVLLGRLRRLRNREGHWGTTISNALAVLALAEWETVFQGTKGGRAIVMVGENRMVYEGGEAMTVRSTQVGGAACVVRSVGTGPVFVSWVRRGVPFLPRTKPVEAGLKVARTYLDADGNARNSFALGERVLVRIAIQSSQLVDDLVIADLLPGGLEAELASLETRDKTQDKAKGLFVHHTEKRDERTIVVADMHKPLATFEYMARAVSRGTYVIPRITGEDMYDAAVRGESGGADRLVVK